MTKLSTLLGIMVAMVTTPAVVTGAKNSTTNSTTTNSTSVIKGTCDVTEFVSQIESGNECELKLYQSLLLNEFNNNTAMMNDFLVKGNYHNASFVKRNGDTAAIRCQFAHQVLANISTCICPKGCNEVAWTLCAQVAPFDLTLGLTVAGRLLAVQTAQANFECWGHHGTPTLAHCQELLPATKLGTDCASMNKKPGNSTGTGHKNSTSGGGGGMRRLLR